MTTFWIICALLVLVALLFVVLPLWRQKTSSNRVLRNSANLEILRDQIREMDTDLRNGLLTEALYEQGKRELELRLLEEVKEEQAAAAASRKPILILALFIVIALPLVSVELYSRVGNVASLSPQQAMAAMSSSSGIASTPAQLAALEKKVADNPQDGESLLFLARSYAEQEQYGKAAQAYDRLTQSVTDEAWIWADYADALAMAHGQSLLGMPTKLIDKALALKPDYPKALALAGSAAMERGDYAAAVKYWTRLQQGLPADSQDAKMIESGIQQAKMFLARSQGKPVGKMAQAEPEAQSAQTAGQGMQSISGRVELSPALKSRVDPSDTVFVLARAAQGPKMPLAVVRKQVKDLPFDFTLDDSMAMAPQMKLSNFDEVVVVARVSKSGNAISAAGDLQGVSNIVKRGSAKLKITIDSEVR